MKTLFKLRVEGQISSVQRFCFSILLSTLLLQCAFCKEKTEHTSVTRDEADVGKRNGWNAWEPDSKTAGLNWTPVETYQAYNTGEPKPKVRAEQKNQSERKGTRPVKAKDSDLSISDLRKTVFKYGKYLFDFVTGSNSNMGLRTFFPDSPFSSPFESRSFDGGWRREGGGGGRGAIDWLARLIGVEGKSLGEFLREYQVHVLYDLVFTFFKWIFFLYAGLLIP